MTMPAHVVASLIERGVLFADRMSRNARFGHCAHCRAVVVRGLDHDRCAMGVIADPYPLSPLGEVAAVFANRLTFDLTPYAASDYRLDHRGPEQIRATPAGTGRGDVVAWHVCGAPRLGQVSSRIKVIAAYRQESDQCPF